LQVGSTHVGFSVPGLKFSRLSESKYLTGNVNTAVPCETEISCAFTDRALTATDAEDNEEPAPEFEVTVKLHEDDVDNPENVYGLVRVDVVTVCTSPDEDVAVNV
jgi:hypothetical protein